MCSTSGRIQSEQVLAWACGVWATCDMAKKRSGTLSRYSSAWGRTSSWSTLKGRAAG